MGLPWLTLFLSFLSFCGATHQAYSDVLAAYPQHCNLELKIYDSNGDGWQDNKIQLRAGPITPDFAVPLIPNTQCCQSQNDSYGEKTLGTMLGDCSYCSFSLVIPSGFNIEADVLWQWASWPNEIAATLQLDYVQAYFGPVVVSTSSYVNMTDAQGRSTDVPVMTAVNTLVCGPLPSAVSAVQAAPNTIGTGQALAQTTISWTPVISSGVSVAFAVTVEELGNVTRNAGPVSLGVYTSSSTQALLWPNTDYRIVVKSVNKYGQGPETSFNYRTHSYAASSLDAVLLSAGPHAWSPDGALIIWVNNAAVGVFSVKGDGFQETYKIPIVADDTPNTVKSHFVPPTGSAAQCSFRINQGSVVKFQSDSSSQTGPTYYDAIFTATAEAPAKTCAVCCSENGQCPTYDGYCCQVGEICCKSGTDTTKPYTCCKGAQQCIANYTGTTPAPKTCAVPLATCPASAPAEGDQCFGLLSCNYESQCCCPGDTDEVCGPTVKYSCTGTTGAVWTRSNISLPCQSDPSFRCPEACPTQEPGPSQQCVGTRTCLYGKTCCCPAETDPSRQLCTYQRQWKCPGTINGVWDKTTLVPAACPPLCYSQTKAGECPPATTCSGTVQDLCDVDAQCNGTAKCCAGGCGRQCIQPCDCSTSPTCNCWEKVVLTPGPGCCGGTKSCQTDPTSTQCPLSQPSWDSLPCTLPQGQTCGNGKKVRQKNVRDPVKGCISSTEEQTCSINCPVPCVGSWGDCTQCTSNCKGGTCTRKYTITQQAANNGAPCPYSNGAISPPEPCPGLPSCPETCPIAMVLRDGYGDGWTQSSGTQGHINLTNVATGQQIISQFYGKGIGKMLTVPLLIKSGTQMRLDYYPDKYRYEDQIQFFENKNNQIGNMIYNDPIDNSKMTSSTCKGCPTGVCESCGPQRVAYLTITCNQCADSDPQYCLNVQHRNPCTLFGPVTPAGCGSCAPGYWQSDPNGPCIDRNECAEPKNLCAMANATCINTDGSFQCSCPPGTNWLFGYCETPGVCPTVRFRMEWFDLSLKQKKLYRDAYKCLYDTGKWTVLHSMHGGQDGYPGKWHYGHSHPSGFFYWHHTYSLMFEDLVRQCSIEKNIPELRCFVSSYWDYPSMVYQSEDPEVSRQRIMQYFFTDDQVDGVYIGLGKKQDTCSATHPYNFLAGSNGCWTRGDPLRRVEWQASDLNWGVIAAANKMGDLFSLEGQHFSIHSFVGGSYGGAFSAADPLFPLHHNLWDMYWRTWQGCKGKANWNTNSIDDRWATLNADQNYGPDWQIYGFNTWPVDVYDASAINVRLNTNPPTTTTISIMYSSTSVTRTNAAGMKNCPANIANYVKAALPDPATATTLLQTPGLSFAELVKTTGSGKSKHKAALAEIPPSHLWHTHQKPMHAETHTEWRENLRRFAGASHRADDRHINVPTHHWGAPHSGYGRKAWRQAIQVGLHDPSIADTDIGQKCKNQAKDLISKGTPSNVAYMIALDCICEATGQLEGGKLETTIINNFGIQDLCNAGFCDNTCLAIHISVHGRDENEDEDEDTGSESPVSNNNTALIGKVGVLARLQKRVLTASR